MELQELYKSSSGITKSNISNTRNWNEVTNFFKTVFFKNDVNKMMLGISTIDGSNLFKL